MIVEALKPKFIPLAKIILALAFSSVSLVFFSYHLAYARKIIPGVRVAHLELGNKNQKEAFDLITTEAAKFSETPVKVEIGGGILEFLPKDLGIEIESGRTVTAAFKIGRSGNIIADVGDEIHTWTDGKTLAPKIALREETFNESFKKLSGELEKEAKNAEFELLDGNVVVKKSENGSMAQKDFFRQELIRRAESLSHAPISVPLLEIEPEISTRDLEDLKPQVESAALKPLKLNGSVSTFTLSGPELLSLIGVKKENGRAFLTANRTNLDTYIESLAAQINREPRGEIFSVSGSKVLDFRLSEDGLKLDKEETAKRVESALLGGEKEVILPITAEKPESVNNEYGIKELLGTGVSRFLGSMPGRVRNISLAASRLKGTLVAPGQTFSFNQVLGEVSAATGYDQAYIISEGRTVLGTGGGVCQVSTTVFRAAFNAGLEIAKRSAHAYRVSYYEPPVGFDATVYAPSPDLVFRNDTANYILVWSEVDLGSSTLIFKIYGTADGRTTKMIGPFVSNETAPPPPAYQEDPTLPKGTVKQIDFSAWGADAILKREVYRGGEILHNDTFFSRYQPWRAIYLVGTKDQ